MSDLAQEALRLSRRMGISFTSTASERFTVYTEARELLPKLARRVEELEAENAALREILFKPKWQQAGKLEPEREALRQEEGG